MLRLPAGFATISALLIGLALATPAHAHRLVAPVGQTTGDEFGTSVEKAGDLNADGFGDFIVGAPGNSAAGQSAGRAYIFRGGVAPDSIPDLILTGEAAFDNFGRACSGAGDVNGDGFPDVIVGARNNDFIRLDAGRAYVFFGGPGMNATADWFLNGTGFGEQLGNSVDGAGDVNGDGYDDVVVGANRRDWSSTDRDDDRGRVYVYFGGPGADNVPDWFVTGEGRGDQLGVVVAGAGDVNGDGFADIIAGAFRNDAGGADGGRAYVYFGGAAPDTFPDLVLTGSAAGDEFGRSVAGGGDVNGDGFADVIVGAALDDGGGADAGRAYVFYGGPGADATPDLVLTGTAPDDNFGRWVGGGGDVNGDGYDDVIVGAYLNDVAASNAGAAYVFFGGPGADAIADVKMEGEAAGDEFGLAVSEAGDIDGDGRGDVLVGAHFNGPAATPHIGRAYVFRMIPSVPAITPWGALALLVSLLGASVATMISGRRHRLP